jgi:ferredoxin--NADP+ reductase
VIGTNKKDATETVELLLDDARAGRLAHVGGGPSLDDLLAARGVKFVDHSGWQAIDAAERAAGEPLGRPRVKLGTWAHLLEAGKRITR